jgi:hypothetical protein
MIMSTHRAENPALRERLREILLAADPIGIYFRDIDNRDEYDSAVAAILGKLCHCVTESGVRNVVWSVFVDDFGPQIAGDPEEYSAIARDVWLAYQSPGK